MSVQNKEGSLAAMKPAAFSLANTDIARLERLQKSLANSRGRAFKSAVVRAALLAYEKLPSDKQLAMLVAAEKELS